MRRGESTIMVSFLPFAARLEPDAPAVMTPIKTEGKLQPSLAEEEEGGKRALCGMDGWAIYSGAEFPPEWVTRSNGFRHCFLVIEYGPKVRFRKIF